MAWTASILSVTKNPDGLTVSVTYRVSDGKTNQDTTEPRVSKVLKQEIWRLAQDKADMLNQVDAQKAAVTALNIQSVLGAVDLTPPAPAPPDQQLVDFLAALKLYNEKNGLVKIKKLQQNDQSISDLEAQLRNALTARPEFQQYMGNVK